MPNDKRCIPAGQTAGELVVKQNATSDHTVIDVTRAIGACAVTGEASGVAAALLIKDRIEDRRQLPGRELQNLLRKGGAMIHADLVKQHPKAEASQAREFGKV